MSSIDFYSDDYYEVLGLNRSCTGQDIKRMYRKLAIQWHPDKNPDNAEAEEIFKKIAEAYEVLSDEEKKSIYDRYGKEGLNSGGGGGRRSSGGFGHGGVSFQHAEDIFRHFFGGRDPFAEMMGSAFDDPFFSGGDPFFRQRGSRNRSSMQSSFFGDDPFFRGFGGGFGGGFGAMGSSMSMSTSSMSFGGGGFSGQSVSTTTRRDHTGRKVTQKVTTISHPDGRVETKTEEFVNGKLIASSSNLHMLEN